MRALEEAIERLATVDALLEREAVGLHTLDPARERPTPLAELGRRLLGDDPDTARALHCADVLGRIAAAQLLHFPQNLFWDFDYTAATLVRVAREHSALEFEQHVAMFERLQGLFGCHSPIRFRYVTDFIYGLDWERFVTRDPGSHGSVGPFARIFLERVLARGAELQALVESGADVDYPPLAPGQWRNPFAFSRVPQHELRLHRELAAAGLIPVPGWRVDAEPDWRKPYTRLRLERARSLGIPGDYGSAKNPTADGS